MTYKIIELEQGSQEWLSLRKTKITATDSGVVLNLNPWKTPLQLFEEKLGLREPQVVNDKMREGSLIKEQAREYINKHRSNNFKPVVLESVKHPFMMASLDGLDIDNNNIIEIKCGKGSHEFASKGEIPPYYFAQLQKQIYVSQVNMISYFSYRSDDDNYCINVYRDDSFIEKMIEAEKLFYQCLLNFTPPALCDRDYVKRDSRELQFHLEVWKQTKAEMKLLEAKDELLRDTIIKMCDGISSECNGVRIAKQVTKGRVSYADIPELKNVNLDKYRGKNVTSFRFTEVKGEND